MTSYTFSAIGTEWQIDLYKDLSKQKILKKELLKLIDDFDKKFSRFRKDSWVTKYRNFIGTTKIDTELKTLLDLYKKLNIISNGKFTPLIGKTLEQAGYDADYSLKPGKLTPLSPFLKTILWDTEKITFKDHALLDFGAAGKGFLVDLVGETLEKNGITSYCIDAGGDILYKSTDSKPIKVGLEHPSDPTSAIGVVSILNQSICASAGNRRRWGNYHHTIDPITLLSPDDIIAVWVIAQSTILADALATALYLDPHPDKYNEFKFECLLLYKDYTVLKTKGFEGELYTK